MTPEQRITKLEEEVKLLRQVRDLEFVEEIKRRLRAVTSIEDGASLTGMTIAVRNVTDTGSETVADDYTGAITLTDGTGSTYKIGYY